MSSDTHYPELQAEPLKLGLKLRVIDEMFSLHLVGAKPVYIDAVGLAVREYVASPKSKHWSNTPSWSSK